MYSIGLKNKGLLFCILGCDFVDKIEIKLKE